MYLWLEKEYRTSTSSQQEELEKNIACNAVICATGWHYPALKSKVGASFDGRKNELKKYFDAIMKANSIVVAGAGVVGVELAGEISYMLEKAGREDTIVKLVCAGNYVLGDEYDKKERKLLTKKIQNTHNMEVSVSFYERASEHTSERSEGNSDVLRSSSLNLTISHLTSSHFL